MIILRKITPASWQSGAVIADTMSGAINGSNQAFSTSYEYRTDHITVYYNGQALHPDDDFTQTAADEITFVYVKPISGDNLRATYELDAAVYSPNVKGTESIVLGSTSHTVTFTTTQADTSYNLSVDLITSDANPSVYSYVTANKTVSGFTVFFSGEIDSNNFVLEWEVFA